MPCVVCLLDFFFRVLPFFCFVSCFDFFCFVFISFLLFDMGVSYCFFDDQIVLAFAVLFLGGGLKSQPIQRWGWG